MSPSDVFVGIDVAKADCVVACRPSGATWTALNDAAGIADADTVARLVGEGPALVVLEATGGYETALVTALATAGIPLVVANPRQVRDFAKGTGQLAKTDRLDAALLALCADRVRPTPHPMPDQALQALAALTTRRRQQLEMLVAERNRLEHAQGPGPAKRAATCPLAGAPRRRGRPRSR
jgi:transposase